MPGGYAMRMQQAVAPVPRQPVAPLSDAEYMWYTPTILFVTVN